VTRKLLVLAIVAVVAVGFLIAISYTPGRGPGFVTRVQADDADPTEILLDEIELTPDLTATPDDDIIW
jgi:hypothetical protein